MPRRYHILDVFTDAKLAGNPLAVVLDGEGLDDVTMQRIAREFNLSETVFCAEPRDPVNSAALRIFTPTTEMPFAGHPTIGTAVLLASLQAPDLLAREDVGLVLEERIGPVTCSVRHRRGEAAHARFDVPRLASLSPDTPDTSRLAALLGLEEHDIGFADHKPSSASAGNPVTFVPLASLERLGRARLTATSGAPAMFYLYTPVEAAKTPTAKTPTAKTPSFKTPTFRCRMLSIGYGVPEDPATGSAAAAFPLALMANQRLADGEHDCLLLQGVEMGRPSRIGVAFSVEAGRLTTTAIGGFAVRVAQGTLDI